MLNPLIYEYAVSPSSQFSFCSVPFRLDISPECNLGCRYCFSLARGGKRSKGKKIIDPNWLRRKLERISHSPYRQNDILSEFFSHRLPIHIGGVSDPFGTADKTLKTFQVLNVLAEASYPVVLSTKNPLPLLNDNALEQLNNLNYLSIQVSIPIPLESYAIILEPRAPSVTSRLFAVKALIKSGFHVVVRLQPIILPLLDYVEKEYCYILREIGCKHVIIECLKLPVEKTITKLHSVLRDIKWDAFSYYHKMGALVVGRDWVLPPYVAWNIIKPITEKLHSLGITYGTTDHGLFHLGSPGSCCGLTGREGFDNLFDANFANVIRTEKRNDLTFSDVKKHWLPKGSIKRYINSNSRLNGVNSLLSHMLRFWNSPGNVNSPNAFLGVIVTREMDENGNCIYSKEGLKKYIL